MAAAATPNFTLISQFSERLGGVPNILHKEWRQFIHNTNYACKMI